MSEQRAPSKTPAQPADDSPSPIEAGKREERQPTDPDPEDAGREEVPGRENADQEEGHQVQKLVGVEREGVQIRKKTTRQAGNAAKKPAAKESKRASRVGRGGGKVERGEKAVGVGGDGGGADEGNGQGREVAVPPPAAPPADAPPAVAPTAVPPPAASRDASTQANIPDQAAMEENLALQARLAAFAANSEQHAAVRDTLTRQLALNEREKEDLRHAAAQAAAEAAAAQEAYGRLAAAGGEEARRQAEVLRVAGEAQAAAERQRETAIRVAGEAQAAAQRQLDEARQAMQRQLENVRAEAERQLVEARQAMQQQLQNAQAAAERQRDETAEAARQAQAAAERQLVEMRQLMQQAQSEAEQRVAAAAEAARAETTRALRAAHGQLAAAERRAEQAERQNRDLENQRDAALLEWRDAARSPAPNAPLYNEEGVPGGGEEDEDGGGEELPRIMASPGAAYAAEVAGGQIPNAVAPLARVIETDPRWGTGRREDFEDTPNIGSIELRRYNRSAGNVLYEQNFPIGNFASVRVPMPRGTPQTLALFGRNAHVATPAQSFNRAIMRYEGRGVYR